MPRGDGTGPMGSGSQTGRGAGYCAGNSEPGFASRPMGGGGRRGAGRMGQGQDLSQGMGQGGRGGRGWRNMFRLTGLPRWMRSSGASANAPVAAADERTTLQQQASALQAQLNQIQNRLNELDK